MTALRQGVKKGSNLQRETQSGEECEMRESFGGSIVRLIREFLFAIIFYPFSAASSVT